MIQGVPSLLTATGITQGTFTRSLTIDHLQVASTQTNFPVLVNFTDSTFKTIANGGHVFTTNAFTFSSDSGGASLLTWEVERYNASTGEIVAWVKIASVSSVSDTVFYLRYGTTITTDQSDPTNVWTNNFFDVYHLKDGTTLNINTSVALGRNLTNNNTVTAATGQIDGAAGFASVSNQYLVSAAFSGQTAITLSAWVKATSFPTAYNGVIVRNSLNTNYIGIWVKSNGKIAWLLNNAGVSQDGTGTHTLVATTWYYLVMTYDSSAGLVGYVDGASDATHAANGNANTVSVVTEVGEDHTNTPRYWNGVIDEVRGANVARSADWVTCEFNNQKTSSTFVALGAES
jgi:hypothetical protein